MVTQQTTNLTSVYLNNPDKQKNIEESTKREEVGYFNTFGEGCVNESGEQQSIFHASERQAVDISSKQEELSDVDNYQTYYVAHYVAKNEINSELKVGLEDFIKSQNFLSLCTEFSILLSVIYQNNENFMLEDFISRFAEKAKSTFSKLHMKENKIAEIQNKIKSANNTARSRKKTNNTHATYVSECKFGYNELNNIKNMMKGIFSNLSKNTENLSSLSLLLFSPYLEYNLFKMNEPDNAFFVSLKSSPVGLTCGLINRNYRSESKVLTFLKELLLKYEIDDQSVFDLSSDKMLHKFEKQFLMAHKLNSIYFFKIMQAFGASCILLSSYAISTNDSSEQHIQEILFFQIFLMLLAAFYYPTYILKIYDDVKLFDSTKQDIEGFFEQKTKKYNILDLFRKYIVLPFLNIEFIVDQKTTAQVRVSHDYNRDSSCEYGSYQSEDQYKRSDRKGKVKKAVVAGKETDKISDDSKGKFTITNTEASVAPTPIIDPKTVIFNASSFGKTPSRDILFEDLKPVYGRHGNLYYVYWDKDAIENSRYNQIISKIKSVYDNQREVQSGRGSQGYKMLEKESDKQHDKSRDNIENSKFGEMDDCYVGNSLYSHEIKAIGTASRVCGFIRKSIVGHVVIFCYFDYKGKATGH